MSITEKTANVVMTETISSLPGLEDQNRLLSLTISTLNWLVKTRVIMTKLLKVCMSIAKYVRPKNTMIPASAMSRNPTASPVSVIFLMLQMLGLGELVTLSLANEMVRKSFEKMTSTNPITEITKSCNQMNPKVSIPIT